jgi:hypothetical protein
MPISQEKQTEFKNFLANIEETLDESDKTKYNEKIKEFLEALKNENLSKDDITKEAEDLLKFFNEADKSNFTEICKNVAEIDISRLQQVTQNKAQEV